MVKIGRNGSKITKSTSIGEKDIEGGTLFLRREKIGEGNNVVEIQRKFSMEGDELFKPGLHLQGFPACVPTVSD